MASAIRFRFHSRQRGVALIAVLAVIVMGALWGLMSSLSAASNRRQGNAEHNARVLAEAKTALLGYIVAQAGLTSERHPGRLPCPEPVANAGSATLEGYAAAQAPVAGTACANVGRFPWRTVGTDKLIDAQGQPLWYSVTIGNTGWAFADSSSVLSINSNKTGGLSINGAANAAVAVIIAPGSPLTLSPNANQIAAGCVARTQQRTTGAPNYQDYLECDNFATPNVRTTMVDNATNEVFNDQVVTITAKEVISAIEGVIEARLKSDVLPQLKTMYGSATWGASAAQPYFPFPARFKNDAATTFDPESYQGRRFGNDANSAGANTQGLLPVTVATCNPPLTDDRCSSAFVQWSTTGITVTKTSGPGSITYTCTSSIVSEIRCSITQSATCSTSGLFSPDIIGALLGGNCNATMTQNININATAQNLGMAMRVISTTGITNLSSPSMVAPLAASGSAATVTTGSLSGTSSCTNTIIFGLLFPCTMTKTATVTIPITVFQDHPLVNPSTSDAWYWFTVNKWYEVTYYAVAQNFLPGGSRSCGTCLSLSGNTTQSNIQSLLVLAGRSLTQTARPNANIADFLDAANADGNTAFKDATVTTSNNDRMAVVN